MKLPDKKESLRIQLIELHNEIVALDKELSTERGLKHEAINLSGFTHQTYYNMIKGKGRIKNMVIMRDAMKQVIKSINI